MPDRMRKRHKQLNARSRRLHRLVQRPSLTEERRFPQWHRIDLREDRLWDTLNAAMTHFFTAGETPHGLDDFLKEAGLA